MSIESGHQLSELRSLARHNVEQINRAAVGLIEIMRNATESIVAPSNPANAFALDLMRKTLDFSEANVVALCDHAQKLAQAGSAADCMKLHTDFVRSSIASMQKVSMGMVGADGESGGEAEAKSP